MNKYSLVKNIHNRDIFKLNKLSLSILMIGIAYYSSNVYAEEIFNPAFFDDSNIDVTISDLSKFNKLEYNLPGNYRVDILLNGRRVKTLDINFFEKEKEDGHTYLFPCFSESDLESFEINLPKSLDNTNNNCVDFTSLIPDSKSDFDFEKQILNLSFPQTSMKREARGYISPNEWDSGINALYLNYMISAYDNNEQDNKNFFINFNSGFNLGSWQFRNNSNFSYNSIEGISDKTWNNINSYVKKNIIPIKSTVLLGENNTNNDIFESFAFLGASLSSSEEMYPESLQGFAPIVRGIAKTNANVTIRQNGYTVYQISVAPGPFVIDDLNPTSVSGDLNVEIDESDGTKQNYTIPYSSLPILQREGRSKYNITLGKIRNTSKNANKLKFLQSTVAYGLTNNTSIYAGIQFANEYKSGLIGIGQNLGSIGALSFDVTHSSSKIDNHTEKTGQSLRFLYAKSLLKTGTTFRLLGYRYSTESFYTLNEAVNKRWELNYQEFPTLDGLYNSSYYSRKGRFEANISHTFSNNIGALYLVSSEQSYWGTSRKDRWIQAGYSKSYNGINFSFSISNIKYSTDQKDDLSFSANMSFPIDSFLRKKNSSNYWFNSPSITTTLSGDTNGYTGLRSGISGTMLENRNLRYNINQSLDNDGNSGTIGLDYNGQYGTVGAGYNYDKGSQQVRFNANGSVMLHSRGVTFGQYLNGTGILVEVPKTANIRVDNYPGIKTDRRGYAIIPYATPYRENRVSLSTNSFSDNLEIERNVSTSVPTDGAITRASFKPRVGMRALVNLSHNNKPVPFVSSVIEEFSSTSSLVDMNGSAYLSGLPVKGTLKVSWGKNSTDQCQVDYDISEHEKSSNIVVLDLACQ